MTVWRAAVTVRGMEDTLWSRVAAEIRAEMARRRLSQMDVARLIGKPQTTVSRWISGTTKLDLEQLELLAQALGVSVPELVSWGEVNPELRARQGSNLRPSDYEDEGVPGRRRDFLGLVA